MKKEKSKLKDEEKENELSIAFDYLWFCYSIHDKITNKTLFLGLIHKDQKKELTTFLSDFRVEFLRTELTDQNVVKEQRKLIWSL